MLQRLASNACNALAPPLRKRALVSSLGVLNRRAYSFVTAPPQQEKIEIPCRSNGSITVESVQPHSSPFLDIESLRCCLELVQTSACCAKIPRDSSRPWSCATHRTPYQQPRSTEATASHAKPRCAIESWSRLTHHLQCVSCIHTLVFRSPLSATRSGTARLL
jgi:hypothetical protein